MSVQLKGGTAAAMTANNPLLLARQLGVETDTGLFKIGNGVTSWNGLPYSSGPPGPVMQSFLPGEEGEPGPPSLLLPTGMMTRSGLGVDAKNWTFLGTATGATVTVGPVIWTGQYRQFLMQYVITNYNGGTPVGRLLLGAAAISTTALTNSFAASENVAAPTTGAGATAIPGVPLATTLSNIGRAGYAFIDGASGAVKTIDIVGNGGTPAVATAPVLFRASSFFSDLGTNLLLQRAQLTVYDTLTAVAASAQTFSAGTQLVVWGRNND